MAERPGQAGSQNVFKRFRRQFWLPPRAHGEVIGDRTVSFLELFYDLVYVVLIARTAHTLAEHVSWEGFVDFAVIFGLIWIGWLNGSLYHELHGREDGRSRTFIFLQMLLLAFLAIYAGDATGDGGTGFAIVYTLLLLVLAWLWYTVRREDTEEFMAATGIYLAGMLVSAAMMVITIFLQDDVRLVIWAILVGCWIVGGYLFVLYPRAYIAVESTVTESMVERFGLFTIIVLGEVVVGVVDGLSTADRDFQTLATGALGLTIGFGFWWTYFDFVGRRMPRGDRSGFPQWIYGHCPVALAIAASGAAMVSLIEHADDDRAPAATAWLLSGSVALWLITLVIIIHALSDFKRFPAVYRPVSLLLGCGAAAVLLVGWLRPAPWMLVLFVAVIHSAIWFLAVDRWFRAGYSEDALP